MSRKIINTNIRLNLEHEADREAWEHLQQLDRRQYKSYSCAVVVAVNDFFARQERMKNDPDYEVNAREAVFLQKLQDMIRQELQNTAPALGLLQLLQGASPLASVTSSPTLTEREEDIDAAMDFVDSF